MTVHPIFAPAPSRIAPAKLFLSQSFFLIMIEGKKGEYYSLTMDWQEMTDANEAFAVLRQSLANDETAIVIHVAGNGARTDASAWFASLWLEWLKEQGFARDDATSIRFIRNHAEPRNL